MQVSYAFGPTSLSLMVQLPENGEPEKADLTRLLKFMSHNGIFNPCITEKRKVYYSLGAFSEKANLQAIFLPKLFFGINFSKYFIRLSSEKCIAFLLLRNIDLIFQRNLQRFSKKAKFGPTVVVTKNILFWPKFI